MHASSRRISPSASVSISRASLSRAAVVAVLGVGIVAAMSTGCGAPASIGAGRAHELYQRGEYLAAEEAAERELERAPEDAELWRLRIDAAIRGGDSAHGVDLYMRWHRLRRHYDDRALRSMAESVFFEALRSADAEVRIHAIDAVASSGIHTLDRTIAAALDDGDDRVAAAAVAASGDGHALVRARSLVHHADPTIRARVIGALAKRRRERALILAGLRDPSARVRRIAARGLAHGTNPEERAMLLEVARVDGDGSVRAAALSALRPARGAEVVAAARGALADDHLGVRLAGLSILAMDPEAHVGTLDELAGSSDIFVALRASLVVTKAGGEAPIHTLELALAHGLWSVRVAGLNAVAEILDGDAALALVEPRVNDPRPEVRLAAARVLARLGHRGRARALFATELAAPRAATRLQAAVDLLRLDDESARAALEQLASKPDPETRRAAIAAHEFTDNPTLPLIRALGDEVPEVRLTAASVLLKLL